MKPTFQLLATVTFAWLSVLEAQPGDVFPIATSTNKEASGGVAFDGSNALVGIQGDNLFARSPASNQVAALLLRGDGSRVGPMLDTGRQGSAPVVAFGNQRYLLVWADYGSNSTDVYGLLLDPAGTKLKMPFLIDTNASMYVGAIFAGGVVFNGTNYLVVWQSTASPFDGIRAQLVSPDGTMTGPQPIIVAQGSQDNLAPAVGFSGTNALVAWCSQRDTMNELYDLKACLVSETGTCSGIFEVSQHPSPAYNPPSIAWDGTRYFVVWNRDVGPGHPAPTVWHVYGRFVLADGTVVGDEFPVNTAPGDPAMPQVVYDGMSYLVSAFAQEGTGSVCQYFDTAGNALGATFQPFGPQGEMIPMVGHFFAGTRLLGVVTYLRVGRSAADDPYLSDGDVYGYFVPSTRDAPRLDLIPPRTSGEFKFRLTGSPGFNYLIEVATRLSSPDWTGFFSGTTTNSTTDFADPIGTNRTRFYRAVRQ
jgi:hypothetical protein